jgi:hypothetical protein
MAGEPGNGEEDAEHVVVTALPPLPSGPEMNPPTAPIAVEGAKPLPGGPGFMALKLRTG